MSLNEMNRFTKNPVNLDISRSRFDLSHSHKTTFNFGDLVPIFDAEVIPGQTDVVKTSFVVRLNTPVVPVMDNAYIDVYFFFLPNRIIYGDEKWRSVMGENVKGYWAPSVEEDLSSTFGSFSPIDVSWNTPAAYIGLPYNSTDNHSYSINSGLFGAYALVWNEWFRDENTQAPVDLDIWMQNTGKVWTGPCLKVNKFHDYFTSALPGPQKGEDVVLPLASAAPVYAFTGIQNPVPSGLGSTVGALNMRVPTSSGWSLPNGQGKYALADMAIMTDRAGSGTIPGNVVQMSSGQAASTNLGNLSPSNLLADLTSATAASVTSLRQAFAIQRMLEKDARGGSRYVELIKAHFNVNCPDYRLQRPEYLGGKRIPINISQVLQTSSSNENGSLGQTGAFSNTSDFFSAFSKSFTEHGWVVGYACVRANQSYSQGLDVKFTRKRRYDYYWPSLANISEQAIYTSELFLSGGQIGSSGSVFGYKEAWCEYRFKNSRVSGLFNKAYENLTYAPWTFSNYFATAPVLNSQFMVQTATQVKSSLVDTDETRSPQLIADFFFDYKSTKPMPLYSIPGLIDHH